jgi:hypothetical protein
VAVAEHDVLRPTAPSLPVTAAAVPAAAMGTSVICESTQQQQQQQPAAEHTQGPLSYAACIRLLKEAPRPLRLKFMDDSHLRRAPASAPSVPGTRVVQEVTAPASATVGSSEQAGAQTTNDGAQAAADTVLSDQQVVNYDAYNVTIMRRARHLLATAPR